MDIHRLISSWPRQLAKSSERPGVVYELAEDLVATHGVLAVEALVQFEDERIALCRPDVAARGPVDLADVGPVYRQRPGGPVAVPTGRVLVRFAEGESLERHRSDLASAGFEVEQPLAYAPHAAWLRPSTGHVSDALRQLARLDHLEGVENVEPQMLTKRGLR